MESLHDRIGRVINTRAFAQLLEADGTDKIEFQGTWNKLSGGDFEKLPPAYQRAILAGEEELAGVGTLVLA